MNPDKSYFSVVQRDSVTAFNAKEHCFTQGVHFNLDEKSLSC